MYTLMNKNTLLIDFHWEPGEMQPVAVVDKVYQKPWFLECL